MAVADVFTAITEDRPYRSGMTNEEALRILQQMAEKKSIDGEIVDLLRVNFNVVNGIREEAQKRSIAEYREFCTQIE